MTLLRNVFILSLFMIACGGNESPDMSSSPTTPDIETPTTNTITNQQTTPPPTAEPAQNADGVWHYTCPNGCDGGSGTASVCGGCGATMVHNTAYHNNNTPPPPPPTNPADANNSLIQTAPPTPEPAQNANGVWHYTCANGCAGGAGSAGPCPSCGATLQHNTAYHN